MPASEASGRPRARRSPCSNRIDGFRLRARATISDERSRPKTSTPRSVRYRPTWPGPQPTSHTRPRPLRRTAKRSSSSRSNGFRASSSKNCSPYGSATRSYVPARSGFHSGAFTSRCERGFPIEPRTRGFELRGEAKQGRFVAVAGDDLHGDGQPVRRAAERQHHRGLAGEVEPDGEGREGEHAAPVLVDIAHHHVDPAELHGHGREARRE